MREMWDGAQDSWRSMSTLRDLLPRGVRVYIMTAIDRAVLLEQKADLITYLGSKIKAGDWHAVADAAMDLREIEAKLDVLAALAQLGVKV